MKYSKYTFFYATRNPFSNWYRTQFTDADGVTYNCTEQYMMYKKAMLFGDTAIAQQILAERDQAKQKELGRKVSGFVREAWEAAAKGIVYDGCKLKFTQNREILQDLLATTGTLLVEAADNDTIWGIGLGMNDPLKNDPKNWRGSNWLGEVLTKLREDLENEAR